MFLSISINIHAEDYLDINNHKLYSETNTFNYKELKDENCNKVNTIDYDFNNDSRYDMSIRNKNIVSNYEPMITVFTHGWDGHAKDWSSLDGIFGYNQDSLIYKLMNNQDSYLYVAHFTEGNNIKQYVLNMFDVTSDYILKKEINLNDENYANSYITDISKHIIFLMI